MNAVPDAIKAAIDNLRYDVAAQERHPKDSYVNEAYADSRRELELLIAEAISEAEHSRDFNHAAAKLALDQRDTLAAALLNITQTIHPKGSHAEIMYKLAKSALAKVQP